MRLVWNYIDQEQKKSYLDRGKAKIIEEPIYNIHQYLRF
ncbi:hypothetical protein F383_37325 [Gossypium arboreum]|uniref:Uncharacterized protein n=1 Tax=Gossypium arboreum TaxID=29729 RepID=A0A0B0MGI9_GOSAR|nr:hypothetical protein F383_36938 [Gossypium arboreum]KHF98030.1 hypothetical protein F383_37325 [Gossypium arboreum]